MSQKIIFFYPSLENGGVTKNLVNIIEGCPYKNLKLHLISSDNPITKKTLCKYYFHKLKLKYNFFFLPGRFNSSINAIILLYQILKKFKKNTIVHSMQSNVAAIIVCLFTRNKVIIRNSEDPISSTIYSENFFFSFIVFLLKIIFYNFSDKAITNSLGSKKSLGFFFFDKKKIKTIYNPYLKNIIIKKYKKNKTIVNIARLRKQKDHETLIRAFKIFNEYYKDYKLIIIGHGNLENKLKRLVLSLNLKNKVIFTGWVKNPNSYLKKSKLFVLSSLYEGLGNVLIDAINYDTPCIATNCRSGPNEILKDGRGGYLVPVKDYIALSQSMIMAIKKYQLSRKKNNFAKKYLKRFNMKNNVNLYFNFLLN
jgi:glycosyltransferase involved in cell wall biosynthesis